MRKWQLKTLFSISSSQLSYFIWNQKFSIPVNCIAIKVRVGMYNYVVSLKFEIAFQFAFSDIAPAAEYSIFSKVDVFLYSWKVTLTWWSRKICGLFGSKRSVWCIRWSCKVVFRREILFQWQLYQSESWVLFQRSFIQRFLKTFIGTLHHWFKPQFVARFYFYSFPKWILLHFFLLRVH